MITHNCFKLFLLHCILHAAQLVQGAFYVGKKPLQEVVAKRKEDHESPEEFFDNLEKAEKQMFQLYYEAVLDPEALLLYQRKMDDAIDHAKKHGLDPDDPSVSRKRPTLVYSTTKTIAHYVFTTMTETLPKEIASEVMKARREREEEHELFFLDPICSSDVNVFPHGHKTDEDMISKSRYCRVPYAVLPNILEFELSVKFYDYALDMTDEEREKALTPDHRGWTQPVDGAHAVVDVVVFSPTQIDGKEMLEKLVKKCNTVYAVSRNRSHYEIKEIDPNEEDQDEEANKDADCEEGAERQQQEQLQHDEL
mmetsp:Transcript_8506/g.12380  ORF Transcript_8506/g.12380 Transcript_8506/m.12380 type:complete len:309 (+) Transcript_8506:97-1023(+)|eukprot:CAMPEP_0195521704 /NCGR_PEP_ID=MMETSP0794_2-20130614/19206_1 /TAXON_ID=515487 /ORGANISM="Stephanopyxis turris, Strain CCMP 815" /LENGTH=308 /DNA_ID=CAMNT_0040651313 /DNA_START=93 /DNA_END=1019 /DNA_ORIENTATION=+